MSGARLVRLFMAFLAICLLTLVNFVAQQPAHDQEAPLQSAPQTPSSELLQTTLPPPSQTPAPAQLPHAPVYPPRTEWRQAAAATFIDNQAARTSDPGHVAWGAGVELCGAPPAIVLLAPHKTGSTFFTKFLHDVATFLGLCWYTENAAFMYLPINHSKCASPSCGHHGQQRQFEHKDGGWGQCSSFVDAAVRASSKCADVSKVQAPGVAMAHTERCTSSLSVQNGLLWGPLRLPREMRTAGRLLGSSPWRWLVVLHSRHPGDTLVSQYHSFGWTHPAAASANAEQRRAHAIRQAAVRNTSIDAYVESHLVELQRKYAVYTELRTNARIGQVSFVPSRYEDLIADFPRWLDRFLSPLTNTYGPKTLNSLRQRLITRHARSFRPDGRHKRSVVPGRFAAEVDADVAARLRAKHFQWWSELGYAQASSTSQI